MVLILFAVLVSSCAGQARGSSESSVTPRDVGVPSSCLLTEPITRAYGTSWKITCGDDASARMGSALANAGWRVCDPPDATTLRYRRGDLVTTIAPKGVKTAQLIQMVATSECP